MIVYFYLLSCLIIILATQSVLMALNYIWIAFFLIGFLAALGQLIFAGNTQIFNDLVNSVFSNAKTGFEISLGLTGALTGALPVAFMKPLSGSGARGLMIDAMKSNGPDSFIGRLSCTLQGTTDTTFYIIAVYFGSVGIKNTRYSIGCGLLADLAGFVTAIFVAYLFFT